MLFQRLISCCLALAMLLVGAQAAADPLSKLQPWWMNVPIDVLRQTVVQPVPSPPILTFGPSSRAMYVARSKGTSPPDEFGFPSPLGVIDLGYERLRFGPIEPNCMAGYSLTQQFLNPRVSRDVRRAWAMLHKEPFPMSEPEIVSVIRSIVSPGITANLSSMDSIGIGLRSAPDLGYQTYCVNVSFIRRF